MRIAVLLLLKNAGSQLDTVLKAIRAQNVEGGIEILAIDSGSRDSTLDCLREHKVRCIQIPPDTFNHGETRNLAANEADSAAKYIVYLSQDALPANEHWLHNLIQPMEDDPVVAGTFSRHIPHPGTSPSLVRQLTTMWQSGGTERLVKELPDDLETYERDKFFYIYFSNTSSAIRREVWELRSFRRLDFAEDADWADRVLRSGYKLVYEPTSLVLHSHDYGIIDQFRQNVDYTEAMVALFDLPYYRRLRHLPLQLVSVPLEVLRDWRFMRRSSYHLGASLQQQTRWVLRSPFWHMASVMGGWTGAYLDRLPASWRESLGRQRRIQRGVEDR